MSRTVTLWLLALALGQPTAFGYLTLNSRPWSYIYIDGVKLKKTTPMPKHRLSIGMHRVRLERPEAERSEEFSVEIQVGQTITKVVDFTKK